MKLQKATRCALYAIIELAAQPDGYLSVASIAERHNISTNHLAKVLRDLGRARLVESVRGAGGGYRFCGNARRVTLLDVVRLFEDIGEDSRTIAGSGEGADIGVALARIMGEIEELAEATLDSVTLETMLKLVDAGAKPPGTTDTTPDEAPAATRQARR